MSPLEEDALITQIDGIMSDLGYTRRRMHVTGKRYNNFPDLLLYDSGESRDSLTVGIEQPDPNDAEQIQMKAKFVNRESEVWNSVDAFRQGIGPWLEDQRPES